MAPGYRTKDNQAEAGLASSVNLEELLNTVPDAMFVTGTDGTILHCNRQADALFGYRREQLVGQSIELLLPDRFRGRHLKHRETYLAAPRVRPMGTGLELYGLRNDGTEVPVEISLSPTTYRHTPVVIASVRDVSARKQLEEERMRLFEEAREAVRIRNEFLSAISHDLGNPVAAIRLESRRLLEAVADGGRTI